MKEAELERLLAIQAPPAPGDFAEFWRDTYAQAEAIAPRAERVEIAGTRDFRVFEVGFDSWGGFRSGAWLTVPRNDKALRGFVVGHGYAGRQAPDDWLPVAGAAAIFPCARGFDRSARADLPNVSSLHVLHGIERREDYVHRACAAELWAAARALVELVPECSARLDYLGGSFGGGVGALMLPWTRLFTRAFLSVPSFGNHPLRLTVPCVGSGEAVRLLHARRPEVSEVLAYFDSASAMRHATTPVLFECALDDPAVIPEGQFSVHNAAACEKELIVRRAAHCEYPEQAEDDRAAADALRRWFAG